MRRNAAALRHDAAVRRDVVTVRRDAAALRRDAGTAGFTLVEVLVALSVLGLLAAVLLRGVVAVRADAEAVDDRTAGLLLARAVLDEALGDRRLPDGTYRGLSAGRGWTLTAAPAGAGDGAAEVPAGGQDPAGGREPAGGPPRPRWRPQRLTVAVAAARRPVVIGTVRLAALRATPGGAALEGATPGGAAP